MRPMSNSYGNKKKKDVRKMPKTKNNGDIKNLDMRLALSKISESTIIMAEVLKETKDLNKKQVEMLERMERASIQHDTSCKIGISKICEEVEGQNKAVLKFFMYLILILVAALLVYGGVKIAIPQLGLP